MRTRFAPALAGLAGLAACTPTVPPDVAWPSRPVPAWAAEARFAVTVNLEDRLGFVGDDALQPMLFGTLPVGDDPVALEGPHHVAASPDGQSLYYNLSNYVPGTGSGPHGSHGTGTVPGSLVRVDSRTAAPRGEVTIDRSPGDVILTRDGKTAFVSHYDLLRLQAQLTSGGPPESGYSTIAVVDTDSMKRLALLPVCATAHGLGLSPDERTLYVTCSQSDQLGIVDVSTREAPAVLRTIPVGPTPGPLGTPNYGPYALAVSPKDGTVWVSDTASGDVRVYDPQKAAMDGARTVVLGGVAMFGAFDGDGTFLYVPHQGDDQVTRIETATGQIETVALPRNQCLNAHALVPRPDRTQAIVVCEGDHVKIPGSVLWMTLTPQLLVTGSQPIGMFPDGAAWIPPAP